MISLLMKFLNKINFNKLYENIIFVSVWSLFLLQFNNKSNINSFLIIPIITALTSKYFIGDIDKGYQFSMNDVIYWLTLISSSLITIIIYKTIKK